MKAALTILRYYRKYKLRDYVHSLQKLFNKADKRRDYGKSLIWPKPPLVGRNSEAGLKHLFAQWRARMILKKYPRAEWPQLRLQIITASAIKGRRQTWGQNRKWLGNYLANNQENTYSSLYTTSVNNLKNTDNFRGVLFSAFVKKYNHCNKSAERVIIITDGAIYKLDNSKNKFKNLKRTMAINELTGISISPGKDQLIIFHSDGGNDLIVSLQGEHEQLKEDRIGEVIGVVNKRYYELNSRDLNVNVGQRLPTILGKKQRTVIVEGTSGIDVPFFKNASPDIIYQIPMTYANGNS
jgi:myosin-1